MSSSIADQTGKRLNPVELKIDLLCRGLIIDGTCRIKEEGRPVCCYPGDFASGLELILPGEIRELWVNVPICERFVEDSPYHLRRRQGAYHLFDERCDLSYSVKLAPKPDWYGLQTARGTPMSQIGVLQGTFLAIDFGEPDRFWFSGPAPDSSSGGSASASASSPAKNIEDIVETAAAAQKRSGITFALLRGESPGTGGLASILPYVQALKREVGVLVGVQCPPEDDLSMYQHGCSLGIDHLSFWFESLDANHVGQYARGAEAGSRRERCMRALEYSARILGKGRVSGELIAGLEPVENTLRSIEYFVGVGALPLISIFRPLRGTEMENLAPPDYADMLRVFRHVYQTCRAHNLPIGIAPNIRLSALPHPEDTLYLEPDLQEGRAYQRWIFTMQQMMRPYFLRRMRKHSPPQA